jgi:hypothetical protein
LTNFGCDPQVIPQYGAGAAAADPTATGVSTVAAAAATVATKIPVLRNISVSPQNLNREFAAR